MGLDMYLNRMPRYKEVTAKQISATENYFDWLKAKEERSEYANYSLKEWCGYDESELPDKEAIEFFKSFCKKRYSDWDIEKKYGFYHIMEDVGYWRKSNQIHAWLVNHVQDGIDDCDYHHEVTKEILEELRETCETVLNASKLVSGKIYNGTTYKDGLAFHEYVDGTIIENTFVAEELLPTQDGFFFGGTDYDEYYVEDLKNTIKIIDNVLATTDFETQMIYYRSSW